MNDIGNNTYKLILFGVIAVLLILRDVFTWIEKHPATTVVLVGGLLFGIYLFFTKEETPPPSDNPPS
jgi:hypothetical protein